MFSSKYRTREIPLVIMRYSIWFLSVHGCHMYFPVPERTRISFTKYLRKFIANRKTLTPQSEHKNGFSPLCYRIWTGRTHVVSQFSIALEFISIIFTAKSHVVNASTCFGLNFSSQKESKVGCVLNRRFKKRVSTPYDRVLLWLPHRFQQKYARD